MPTLPQPWATGPQEILQHSLEMLGRNDDVSRRLALIAIDNAVELTIKTFLGLPKRITGLGVPRRQFQEMSESFPALLDGLEKYATDRLDGVDLGAIEWYHRLRNQLYHQGNGLTVARDKVEVYAELAKSLFRNLFGVELLPESTPQHTGLLGEFLEAWNQLEAAIIETVERESPTGARPRGLMEAALFLEDSQYIGDVDTRDLRKVQDIRNRVVHGMVDYREAITPEIIAKIRSWTRVFVRPS
jgi:hypothetical protein